MANEIQIFRNPQFGEIRTVIGCNGEPMFCLADLCKTLGLRVQGVTPRLKEDGVNRIEVTDSLGRHQSAIFVSEQNLYKVIMRSDKENAEPFQDWVCGEVLPSIRKHGGYIAAGTNESDDEIMAKAVLIANATIQRRDQRIRELLMINDAQSIRISEQNETIGNLRTAVVRLEERTAYLDRILTSKETVTTTPIAADYGMSAKAFNIILRNKRIQRKVNGQWILYHPYNQMGYVHSQTIEITHSDGTVGTKMNTRWRQSGRLFLYNTLKASGILPLIER